MTWRFALLFLAQVPLLLWCGRLFARRGMGFFTLFHILFFFGLTLPFVLIACRERGWINPDHLLGAPQNVSIILPLGDGIKPMLFMLLTHACFVLGGMIAVVWAERRREPVERLPDLDAKGWKRFAWFTFITLEIALAYILVRAKAIPDFPLFHLFSDDFGYEPQLRDLAFAYGTRHQIPWIFWSSIHSQFYRILLPLSALSLFVLWRSGGKRRWVLACAVIAGAGTLEMAYGTMKRTPLVYLAIWVGCWWCLYRPFNLRLVLRLSAVGVLLAGILFLISSEYGMRHRSLPSRVIYGESISDFLAVEHHPQTFPFRGVRVFAPYLAKMLGSREAHSFSQEWKHDLTGGTGVGFDAVGAFTEWFVAFGWTAAALASLVFGAVLAHIDSRLTQRTIADDERPFLAGLLTIVAAMSVKGLLAQFFTGGAFTLLVAYCVWRFIRPSNPVAKTTT